jgi:radical SAM superfamily enzyme YgiQ (UPF0313 family)
MSVWEARLDMKLALITPKSADKRCHTADEGVFKTSQSDLAQNVVLPRHEYWSGGGLGLLIVAALTPPDFDIEYIDENYEELKFSSPYDLVGISAMTQQATRAYEIADKFRSNGITVVIGGIHATVLSEEARAHADAVVIGEAENTWPDLIADFVRGEVKPFYISSTSVDITRSPLPRYDLLKKYDYKMIWLQTTRGCPRECEFCIASNIFGKTYRHKTMHQVLGEINYIRGLWNEPIINFADDNMFINKAFSRELIHRLKSMELRWVAQTDVAVAEDSDFLELLQSSGCKMLFVGFETLSKDNKLDKHDWKQKKIENYSRIIGVIQSYGIGVLGAFIIGLDHDEISIVDSLSQFIVDNRLFASQVTILTPLPGTRLRQRLLEEKRILTSDWSKYTFENAVFIPKKMSTAELETGLREIYKRVYGKEARVGVVQHFKEIYQKLHAHHVSGSNYNS